ncbi:MAG: hypothetical protein RIS45_335 [Planctomycetota bacterium]
MKAGVTVRVDGELLAWLDARVSELREETGAYFCRTHVVEHALVDAMIADIRRRANEACAEGAQTKCVAGQRTRAGSL